MLYNKVHLCWEISVLWEKSCAGLRSCSRGIMSFCTSHMPIFTALFWEPTLFTTMACAELYCSYCRKWGLLVTGSFSCVKFFSNTHITFMLYKEYERMRTTIHIPNCIKLLFTNLFLKSLAICYGLNIRETLLSEWGFNQQNYNDLTETQMT